MTDNRVQITDNNDQLYDTMFETDMDGQEKFIICYKNFNFNVTLL